MHLTIDQSGKIERTNVDTVLAYASQSGGRSVRVPASVKRECLAEMRNRGKGKVTAVIQLFSAALFLLLEDTFDESTILIIDQEYPGHEGNIKGMLLRMASRRGIFLHKDQIIFQEIGKKANAHFWAYGVYAGKRRADRTLTTRELMELL